VRATIPGHARAGRAPVGYRAKAASDGIMSEVLSNPLPMHDTSSRSSMPAPAEPAWDVARLFPSQGDWTQEQYLALPGSRLIEFEDGRIEVLLMPTEFHQFIVAFLYNCLTAFIMAADAGKALFAPFPVRLRDGKFREPDVLFIKKENYVRRKPQFWEGADLVMEVVSPDDRRRDIDLKRREYAQASIAEYWIIDPRHETISVLTLEGESYKVAGEYRKGQQAGSALLPAIKVDVTATFNVA